MDYKQYLRIRAQLTDYLREKLKTFDPEDPQYQELAEDLINWFNERGEDEFQMHLESLKASFQEMFPSKVK